MVVFLLYLRTDSRYLFKIPEGYGEKYVGPLMCGGLTVAAPLFEYAGQKVGFKGQAGWYCWHWRSRPYGYSVRCQNGG
jgi:D-arabinose 1-dehydrogenase-like Zn-dependent alcohol dehydrogenase